MPGLNLSQPPLHFVAVFQPPRDDYFLQTVQGSFHVVGKSAADRLLFFLAARRAAQDVCLLALRNGYLFHLHFGPHSRPVLFQQFRLKLLHLAAWRSHQILALTFADGLEILLAHDAAIQHPRSFAPFHTCVPPCAESSPWSRRRR